MTNIVNKTYQVNEFEHIYMLYFNELYRFAYHYVMSEDAQDIVQDVFVKIYHNQLLLSSTRNVRSYLYKMTKNGCIDYLKHLSIKDKYQDAIVESLISPFECNTEEDCEKKSAAKQQLIELINALPIKQREIIKLRLEGKDYKQIGEMLGVSVGTVTTHINRVYKKVKVTEFHYLFQFL